MALPHALVDTAAGILHLVLPGLLLDGTQRERALPLISEHHHRRVSWANRTIRVIKVQIKAGSRRHRHASTRATNDTGDVGSLEDAQIRCQIFQRIGKLGRQVLEFLLGEEAVVQLHEDGLEPVLIERHYTRFGD